MALVSKDNLVRITKERVSVHKPARAVYLVFDLEGEKFLQIDTFGSEDRIYHEKCSQSVQFDKEMAVFLVNLLKKEFNILE
jgi:hypothetical protein